MSKTDDIVGIVNTETSCQLLPRADKTEVYARRKEVSWGEEANNRACIYVIIVSYRYGKVMSAAGMSSCCESAQARTA
jgi:hypothetical protein